MVFGIYLILSIALFWDTIHSPYNNWVGDIGDPNTFMWNLYWIPYALIHGHNPLFSNYLMYPKGINLLWNTSIIFPAIILTPITFAFGPIFSFNFLTVLALPISASVAYLAIRRYCKSRISAFIGALLYGFSPYMLAQSLGHPNLTLVWYPPFVLLISDLFLKQKIKRKTFSIALGVGSLIQLLTSEEILITTAISAIVLLVILKIFLSNYFNKERLQEIFIAIFAGAVIAFILSLYFLYFQFFGPQRIKGPIQASALYVTDLLNLVVPTQFQFIFPSWAHYIAFHFSGNGSEWTGYIGAPLLFVAIIVISRQWSDPKIKIPAIFALIMCLLSMGPQLHIEGFVTSVYLPWELVKNLPIIDNILPDRLMNFVFLSLAFLIAVVIDKVLKSKNWKKISFSFGVLIICFIPLLPVYPYPNQPSVVPVFFRTNLVKMIPKKSVALIAPYSSSYLPSLWQAEANFRFKMPEGGVLAPNKSGTVVTGAQQPQQIYTALEEIQTNYPLMKLSPSSISRIQKRLQKDSVQTVIVGPFGSPESPLPKNISSSILNTPSPRLSIQQAQTIELFTVILGKKPHYLGGIYIWSNVKNLLAQSMNR